jgi:hypothetical protein
MQGALSNLGLDQILHQQNRTTHADLQICPRHGHNDMVTTTWDLHAASAACISILHAKGQALKLTTAVAVPVAISVAIRAGVGACVAVLDAVAVAAAVAIGGVAALTLSGTLPPAAHNHKAAHTSTSETTH